MLIIDSDDFFEWSLWGLKAFSGIAIATGAAYLLGFLQHPQQVIEAAEVAGMASGEYEAEIIGEGFALWLVAAFGIALSGGATLLCLVIGVVLRLVGK